MTDRCQAMDIDGKRCKKKAHRTAEVHFDSEIYGCKWAKVRFCQTCFNQLKLNYSFVVD